MTVIPSNSDQPAHQAVEADASTLIGDVSESDGRSDVSTAAAGSGNLRRAGRSVQWKVMGSAAERVLNILSLAVMARLVTKAEYGIVGIATIAYALVGMMRDLGLSEAIIRSPKSSRPFLNTCFWVRMSVGVGLYLILVIVAAPFAWAYERPVLFPMLLVMGSTYVLDALPTVQESILIREFRVGAATFARVGSLLIGLLCGIWAAWNGWGAWSLIVNIVAATCSSILLLAPFTHWWPGFAIERTEIKHLVRFGGNLTITQLFGWFTESFGVAVLGRIAADEVVGIFRIASVIGRWPDSLLASVLGRGLAVSFFAKVQGDEEGMRVALRRATNILYLFGLTLAALILVMAPSLILVVYGPQWNEVVPYARMIVVGGTALMIRQTLRYWLIASGWSGALSRNQVFTACVAVPVILIGAWYGLFGVTIGTTVACVAESVFLWIANRDRTGMARGGWLVAYWRPITISIIAGTGLWLFSQSFQWWGSPVVHGLAMGSLKDLIAPPQLQAFADWFVPFVQLSLGMVVGGIVWLAATYWLMPEELGFLQHMLGIRWPRGRQ